jgi:hypothetical protein
MKRVDERKEEVRFVTPDWAKSPPPVTDGGALGSQVVLNLHSLMRNVQAYGDDNVALEESISQYLRLINPFILSEGGICLEIAEEGLLLNNRKVRGKREDHSTLKSFLRSLTGLRIGKVEIHNPLDERELKEFVSVLAGLKEGDESNFGHLMKELSHRKVESISATRLELKEKALSQAAERRRYAR